MASVAQDGNGNIAIGYSASNGDSIYPGIRYTGRLKQDTPNFMTFAEGILAHGSGSQEDLNRWGDYSSMNIDPVDDCTFWYTNEYYTTTGYVLGAITGEGRFYQTRIGGFALPGCSSKLITTPDSLTSTQIGGAASNVTVADGEINQTTTATSTTTMKKTKVGKSKNKGRL